MYNGAVKLAPRLNSFSLLQTLYKYEKSDVIELHTSQSANKNTWTYLNVELTDGFLLFNYIEIMRRLPELRIVERTRWSFDAAVQFSF